MTSTATLGVPEAPFEPPFWTAELPGTGGNIGPEPEDFRVDEKPAYLPSGQGEHRYVRIRKQRLTTPDAVRAIARAADVDARDIGYAGLKDKHAITTQWLSLPMKSVAPEHWQLPDQLSVLEVSAHGNKLRTGHLAGNRFSLALVGTDGEAYARADALVQLIRARGVPNYFGAQRFGRGGENWNRALAWSSQGGKARLSSFLLKLYPSVVQSEVFNRYLALRVAHGTAALFAGEIVRLNGSGASFLVEDPEREQLRLRNREVHLTGPIFGPKMRPAAGVPLELEQRAKTDAGVDDRVESTLARFAPGTRRDLLAFPENLVVTEEGPGRLRLDFELAAGSYATVLAREFTRTAWLDSDTAVRDDAAP